MDELQERAEIDRLVEEQRKDDTSFISPERPDMVRLDVMSDYVGVAEDGEIVSYLPNEHGFILKDFSSYHGTLYGYSNRKCKCAPCKRAMADCKKKRRAEKAA